MVDILHRLHRLYRRGKIEKDHVISSNSSEPLIFNRNRLNYLELEIETLIYFLKKELKDVCEDYTRINFTNKTIKDLDKFELFIRDSKVPITPVIQAILVIVRGLLETLEQYKDGKLMPFYTRLGESELYLLKDNYSAKLNKMNTRRHSEFKNQSEFNKYYESKTPRNYIPGNIRKVDFDKMGTPRNMYTCGATPRNLIQGTQTPRSRSEFGKCVNIDSLGTPRNTRKSHSSTRYEAATPRASYRAYNGNQYFNSQSEDIMAAKALLGLNVAVPVTETDVRKAYLKAAMRWHPDKMPPNSSEQSHLCFTAIQNAMELLLSHTHKEYQV
ncbi:hypothetical protein cand_032580 [Cryptosporidium andersoni]|uniref:J domain-containing protein n=1 Tax=Cryptosporidium andersoni TaxID=117008 RepID=A0A1J4MBD9_9CRYT|nr:hypothetical protein cand_032580 [Cryptosporidium andersoni]